MPPKKPRGRPAAALKEAAKSEGVANSNGEAASTSAGIGSIPDLPSPQTLVSPNSSPVSAPTETPATTPARSIAPPPRSEISNRGGQGISTRGGRAGAPAGPSRFKPKAVRRGAEEREKAAREEAERKALKEKDAAALERLNNRGRGRGRGRGEGRGGRGRGDAMGMRGRGGASGPFGSAQSVSRSSGGMFAPGDGPKREGGFGGSGGVGGTRSGGSGGASGSRVKTEGGMSHYSSNRIAADGTRIKDEVPEPIYPEEQEGGDVGPRIDIERINLVTDDEDSDGDAARSNRTKGKGTSSGAKAGLRPVRLAREEHKERVTMINTESAAASLQKEDDGKVPEVESTDGLFVQGDSSEEAARKTELAAEQRDKNWSGVWREDEDEVRIKADPEEPITQLGDIMEIDSSHTTPAPTSGLDVKVPVDQMDTDIPEAGADETSKTKPRAKRMSSMKDRKPVLQTEEDKAEYARHLEDVQILAEELGGLQTALASETAAGDAEGDVNMDVQQTKDKEGRLYLFQFPPILPPLYNPIKKEEPGSDDVTKFDISGPPAANDGSDPVDLTKQAKETDAVEIKAEPGYTVRKRELVSEPGFVGKLVVRESGKVELDWGGTSLELGKGAVFDFLTTTVIVDGPEEMSGAEAQGYGAQDGRHGYGTGMGKVMGKFVATPDWTKLFERGA